MSAAPDKAVETVKIEVDGIALDVPKNSMIIEATDRAGIPVPRFCYHRKLSIAANCRMCLVDVEKAPKPLPACATPVMDGMKVYTRSRRAVDAQHAVMEFLLINHPLDCPICDQGGECELQDLAMGYGRSVSRFTERKRVVEDKNVGPLIQTDMTRCIHCTRCVRFLEQIAGTSEMGGTGRADRLEIGTCIENSIDSELSGNIIDLCPVGALTNKPFRYSARAWELASRRAVAGHDGVGSLLHYHLQGGKILRAVPGDFEQANEVWLSDRDRYSHFGLYAEDRALVPRIKVAGEWREVGWAEGIAATVDALRAACGNDGGEALGVLMSPNAATEDYYLAQKLARGLGSSNIDHRLREADFSDDPARPARPPFEARLGEIETADAILLVGSNIRHEAPILGHRVRKAWRAGGAIMAVNPLDWNFHFDLSELILAAPQRMVAELAGVAAAVAELTGAKVPATLQAIIKASKPGEPHAGVARRLRDAGLGVVLLGQLAMSHPQAGALRQLARWIADACDGRLNLLPHGGNAIGAWRAGAVPFRGPGAEQATAGLDARQMLTSPRTAYLLWDFEPDFDIDNPALAAQALASARSVIAVTPFATSTIEELADVILPLAPLAESEGTLHSLNGDVIRFQPAGKASGECRPGWKILRRLGAALELEGFGQTSLDELRAEMDAAIEGEASTGDWPDIKPAKAAKGLYRIGEVPMYSVDALCRRAAALQKTVHADSMFLALSPADARALGLVEGDAVRAEQGGASAEFPLQVSARVPDGGCWLRSSTCASRALGDSLGAVKVSKGGGQA
jgi:NADH-quinone oxidoreductase subunit G